VPRTLLGINPPNAAIQAANAIDDTSLVAVKMNNEQHQVKYM
jgi:hypothetical protein